MTETSLARPEELPMRQEGAASVQVAGVDVITLGRLLAKSGYFKDTRDEAQAVVKILYAQELGIGPVSGLMGIHIIEGKPSPSANLLAAVVRRSRRYDYRVAERTDERCEIIFFDRGQEVGRSSWTMKDATRAKLADKDVWRKYPRAMLFSRAMSEGARVYCPELFGGAPVYTPEELGAEINPESGEPIALPAPPVSERDQVRKRAFGAYRSWGGAQGNSPEAVQRRREEWAQVLGVPPESAANLTDNQLRIIGDYYIAQMEQDALSVPESLEDDGDPFGDPAREAVEGAESGSYAQQTGL